MHMQGEPRTMQEAPALRATWWPRCAPSCAARVAACRAAGIAARRSCCIDPGFGFGKTLAHNLTLLRHLRELARAGRAAAGRLVAQVAGRQTHRARRRGARVYGSVALAVIAALNGARIVRAHDVAATVDALKVVAALDGGG